jgi:hypothetical protein
MEESKQGGGKKKADVKRLLLIGIPMLLAAIALSMLDSEAKLLWFEDNTPEKTSARFFRFSGEKVRRVTVKADRQLNVSWEADIQRGELYADIISQGERLTQLRGSSAAWSARTEEKQSYRFVVTGEGARGSFTIAWEIESDE